MRAAHLALLSFLAIGSTVLAPACSFPDYTTDGFRADGALADADPDFGFPLLDDADASAPGETSIDSAPASDGTATTTLADGRVCTGHDEDFDGIPDLCDNCPNVPNRDQAGGAVGDACRASGPFTTATTRAVFDPFTSLAPTAWTPSGSGAAGFRLDDDGDSIRAGSVGDTFFPFLLSALPSQGVATVMTTVLSIKEDARAGSAGLLLRVADLAGKGTKRFFLCAINLTVGFSAAHSNDMFGCDAAACSPGMFTIDRLPAQAPFPDDVPHKVGDAIGLRASVTSGAVGGVFECRVFNPRAPGGLQSADTRYSLRVSVGSSRWIPEGQVGMYAQGVRAAFHSVDLLRAP